MQAFSEASIEDSPTVSLPSHRRLLSEPAIKCMRSQPLLPVDNYIANRKELLQYSLLFRVSRGTDQAQAERDRAHVRQVFVLSQYNSVTFPLSYGSFVGNVHCCNALF